MSAQKFEKLIDLIINEDEQKARELFHDIVVEKSREIYESLMDEEMSAEGDMSKVDGLMDEIQAEEEGSMMEDDLDGVDMDMDDAEMDMDDAEDDMADAEMDMDDAEMDMDDEGDGDLEDRVVDIEDKLDELMAEFETIMASKDEDEELDADMDDMDDMDDGEEVEAEEEEEVVAEGLIPATKPHLADGTDGSAKQSTVAKNSGQAGMASKPVAFGGGEEKGRAAPAVKEVEGAKSFKNVGGKGKGGDLSAAPKAKTETVKATSPVPRG